jgi:hypothetical protein
MIRWPSALDKRRRVAQVTMGAPHERFLLVWDSGHIPDQARVRSGYYPGCLRRAHGGLIMALTATIPGSP